MFRLESGINESDSIMIEMPILLHSSLSATHSPNELSGLFGEVNQSACFSAAAMSETSFSRYIVESDLKSIDLYTSTALSKRYYINPGRVLSAGIDFVLVLSSSLRMTALPVGVKDFIKIYTVSSHLFPPD